MKPISLGDSGAAVEDVQRRLRSLGYDIGPAGIDGSFAESTAMAVAAFRKDEGLPAGEQIDDAAWAALVDATFKLGDRNLFLKIPYFHGRDVKQMQIALNVLGFGSMLVDGIFGVHTENALREFQLNVGIAPDGIAGQWTFDAIDRLRQVWEGKDATPHSGSHSGFARAAEVLETHEACFWGSDDLTRDVANRIANLALATTSLSLVTSADVRTTPPTPKVLLVEITYLDQLALPGVPSVSYIDDSKVLAARLHTAIQAVRSSPARIRIGLPRPNERSSHRQRQHYTVSLLDAFCTAFA